MMIKSTVGHIEFKIDPQSLPFYKGLFDYLGWSVLYEEPGVLGVGNEQGTSLWFSGATKKVNNDYDAPGMNHLGISVTAQSDVDGVVAYLKEQQVKPLFETPRHRPEFCSSPDKTYYQVMFETPDRILLEVVYTGPLAK
jgi:hypothetical protein